MLQVCLSHRSTRAIRCIVPTADFKTRSSDRRAALLQAVDRVSDWILATTSDGIALSHDDTFYLASILLGSEAEGMAIGIDKVVVASVLILPAFDVLHLKLNLVWSDVDIKIVLVTLLQLTQSTDRQETSISTAIRSAADGISQSQVEIGLACRRSHEIRLWQRRGIHLALGDILDFRLHHLLLGITIVQLTGSRSVRLVSETAPSPCIIALRRTIVGRLLVTDAHGAGWQIKRKTVDIHLILAIGISIDRQT